MKFEDVTPARGTTDTDLVVEKHRKAATVKRTTLRVLRMILMEALLLAAVGNVGLAQAQPSDPHMGSNAAPARVVVGAYVNDVQDLNLNTHSYAMDIYLWFRWRNSELAPAASVEMVNAFDLWGHNTKVTYDEPVKLATGELYQVMRVQGRFSKKFLLTNFPYDHQQLVIEFEDAKHAAQRLIYQPDSQPLAINPRLVLPGFRIGASRLEIEIFKYPTTFGDPRSDQSQSHSRGRIVIPIARPVATYSVKLLLPITCLVLCASLMLLVRPTHIDAQLGIGITSLLAVVALQLTTNQELPNVDYLVLMDKIYISAYVYILAALAVVLRTSRLIDAQQLPHAEQLQRRMFVVLTGLILLVCVTVVCLAILRG